MNDDPITLYAVFQRAVTLSYDGNGGLGSVEANTKYKYYNNTNITNPVFTIDENKFEKGNYDFVAWRLNNISGEIYYPRDSITLSDNAVLYAEWKIIPVPYYIFQGFVMKLESSLVFTVTKNVLGNPVDGATFAPGVYGQSLRVWGSQKGRLVELTSNLLPVKGNTTLRIQSNSSAGNYGSISILSDNEVAQTQYISPSGTNNFDVSGLNDIQIRIHFEETGNNTEALTIQPGSWSFA